MYNILTLSTLLGKIVKKWNRVVKAKQQKMGRYVCSVLLLFLLIHFMAVHEVVGFFRAIMG